MYTKRFVASFATDQDGSPGSKEYTGDVEFNQLYSIDTTDSGYKFGVSQGNNELILEGYFTRTMTNNHDYDFFDLKIVVGADYTSNGHGSYVNIYLSKCFEQRTCGLCGVWDGNTTNDFMYIDDHGDVQNEEGDVFTTQDVSDIFELANDYDIWQSAQEFGVEWMDNDMIVAIEQDSDNNVCNNSIVPPSLDLSCLQATYGFCEEIGCNCDAQGFDLETWLQNCAFDACVIT